MQTLNFIFEGKSFTGNEGDSVAAALLNCNESILGERRNGKDRGVYCGMGVCNECLVTINGKQGLKACMHTLEPGDVIEKESDTRLNLSPVSANRIERIHENTDIIVIGAGPAGLNAAITAKQYGAEVIVVDERKDAGGQYFKPRSPGFRGFSKLDRQHLEGKGLRQKAEQLGVHVYTGQTVWYARKEAEIFEIRSVSEDQQICLKSRSIIICTGAFEIPKIVPGWTLPGVMTIGAGQTMARRYGVAPRGKILIAGNGPLGLQLAHELVQLDHTEITLAEKADVRINLPLLKATFYSPSLVFNGVKYRWSILKSRIPVMYGWEVTSIFGDKKVEGAVLSNIKTNEKRTISCDFLMAGEGFAPQMELPRLLGVNVKIDQNTKQIIPIRNEDCSTNVANLWIAGDAGGMGGAILATAQGKIAALGAMQALFPINHQAKIKQVQRKAKWANGFQTALWDIYRSEDESDTHEELTVCRCEQVSKKKIEEIVKQGAKDLPSIKRETRLAMGRCQGRYCIPKALKLLQSKKIEINDDGLFAPQIPAKVIKASSIWCEKPEWKGHKKARLASRPNKLSIEPFSHSSADVVVLGGGITGVAASFYASKEGASVICIERGRINSEASGGNAGSLHSQLLSWDFGAKAVGDGEVQLQTLPFQQESIELWKCLEKKFDADFEIELNGGLMVAEKEDEVRFLEKKIAAEARVGIKSELVDKESISKIVPEISDTVIAGSWCSKEGKINPLVATPIFAREAKKQGAIIEELTEVVGLNRTSGGYEILTNRGKIFGKRLIIAAGGWTAALFGMLGMSVPVNGAPLQMIVTTPAPKLVNCLMYHAGRHLTLKQSNSGSVIIGGAWPASLSREGHSITLADSIEGNLWVAGKTIPRIGDIDILRTWGAMNIDIDGAPLIGSIPGFEGLMIAATANGYTLGPIMGKEVAKIAVRGKLRKDLDIFSIKRFN